MVTFQNIRFLAGIEAKNDPLNIPHFGSILIFLRKLCSKFWKLTRKIMSYAVNIRLHQGLHFTEESYQKIEFAFAFWLMWSALVCSEQETNTVEILQQNMHSSFHFHEKCLPVFVSGELGCINANQERLLKGVPWIHYKMFDFKSRKLHVLHVWKGYEISKYSWASFYRMTQLFCIMAN